MYFTYMYVLYGNMCTLTIHTFIHYTWFIYCNDYISKIQNYDIVIHTIYLHLPYEFKCYT